MLGLDTAVVTSPKHGEANQLREQIDDVQVYRTLETDFGSIPFLKERKLMRALEKGDIKADESIVLNITGGGQKRLEEELPTRQLGVDLAVSPDDMDAENKILEKVTELLKSGGY